MVAARSFRFRCDFRNEFFTSLSFVRLFCSFTFVECEKLAIFSKTKIAKSAAAAEIDERVSQTDAVLTNFVYKMPKSKGVCDAVVRLFGFSIDCSWLGMFACRAYVCVCVSDSLRFAD